ncbi:hypothetical protein [Dyadobacter sp. CY356]|uniref:hypothetical protein n=1 Tax=Dyadobacter sp. CY356 TaxID=2906442 RepID=UPI001F2687C1|nr:hypothetical protein [Dyadobacter sp. CY356]MCF0055529.1 hypothetical protein [Dyadobacter sp. CY356]
MTHLTKERLEAALEVLTKGYHDALWNWADTPAFVTAREALQSLVDAKTAPTGWNFNMDEAPRDGTDLIGYVDETRTIITWGKVSHVPIYGWIDLTADGPEDRDLCYPEAWQHLPTPPEKSE